MEQPRVIATMSKDPYTVKRLEIGEGRTLLSYEFAEVNAEKLGVQPESSSPMQTTSEASSTGDTASNLDDNREPRR